MAQKSGAAAGAVNADLIGVPGGAKRLVTPALILDRDAMRANMARMMAQCGHAGLNLRPHGKTHKCTAIARAQIAAGAAGICATTGREAIVFAEAGLPGLLVTTPIVQPHHIARLAELHRNGGDITLVFDSEAGVDQWEAALAPCERKLPALVDFDLGMGRTGASSPEAAVGIARRIARSPQLAYAGLQAYSGRVQHILKFPERRAVYGEQMKRLEATLAALAAAKLPAQTVSGGGTGSFAIDAEFKIFTESQAGSYLFMDVDYGAVQLFDRIANPYLYSLFLRTTVVSANQPNHVTINAGFKALATDGPPAKLREGGPDGASYAFFGDEFGMITLPPTNRRPKVGDVIDLITSHCDPTVNMHDAYHVIEGDTLVDIWPIDARGAL